MEFAESDLLSVNCPCEFRGWEIHKENWLSPVGDVVASRLFCTSSSDVKPLAFHPLAVVPVYFLSTGSFRRGGWYFPYLFSLFKWLTHVCSSGGVLVFTFCAQRRGMGTERDGHSHRHGISRGSVRQECQEHQTTTGNHCRESCSCVESSHASFLQRV